MGSFDLYQKKCAGRLRPPPDVGLPALDVFAIGS